MISSKRSDLFLSSSISVFFSSNSLLIILFSAGEKIKTLRFVLVHVFIPPEINAQWKTVRSLDDPNPLSRSLIMARRQINQESK